jgi:hypothetical protein
MSISTARERLIWEVTSPVDRAITVFYSRFVDFYHSILYPFDIITAFLIAENDGKTILAARGRIRSEVTSPFDSLASTWYKSCLEFSGCLLPVKS